MDAPSGNTDQPAHRRHNETAGHVYETEEEFLVDGLCTRVQIPEDVEPDCPICRTSLTGDPEDPPLETRTCSLKHYFHMSCLLGWVVDQSRNTCPSCRQQFYKNRYVRPGVTAGIPTVTPAYRSTFGVDPWRVRQLQPRTNIGFLFAGLVDRVAASDNPTVPRPQALRPPGFDEVLAAGLDQIMTDLSDVSDASRITRIIVEDLRPPIHELVFAVRAHVDDLTRSQFPVPEGRLAVTTLPNLNHLLHWVKTQLRSGMSLEQRSDPIYKEERRSLKKRSQTLKKLHGYVILQERLRNRMLKLGRMLAENLAADDTVDLGFDAREFMTMVNEIGSHHRELLSRMNTGASFLTPSVMRWNEELVAWMPALRQIAKVQITRDIYAVTNRVLGQLF